MRAEEKAEEKAKVKAQAAEDKKQEADNLKALKEIKKAEEKIVKNEK